MTDEQLKHFCFDNAWQNRCDGACDPHVGECKVVHVERWGYFSYCEEAIAEDTRRGLKVNVLNMLVEDTRSAGQKARQEMGMIVQDCER